MARFATDSRPISAQHPIIEFYREEFIKHHRCLQEQRPYYSEGAIIDVETALTRILNELDHPNIVAFREMGEANGLFQPCRRRPFGLTMG